MNHITPLILVGVVWASFYEQFINGQIPCPLCILQRHLMLCAALGAFCPTYAPMLFSALLGGAVALYQLSLHVCPGFGQMGLPVLGLHLYAWSFLVFVLTILATGLLLLLGIKPLKNKPILALIGITILVFLGATLSQPNL